MKNRQSKFEIVLIAGIGVLILLILIFAYVRNDYIRSEQKNNIGAVASDNFAKCLASKGITMYGADWCPHCQNQKKAFGKSFQYVPYVECPNEPKKCLDAGVNGYPTWIFPSASSGQGGKKLEGYQSLEKLSQESGCSL